MSLNHRTVWIKANGPIPVDENGRKFEIHHIDGDHLNNDLSNLKCVSIQEHFDIHFEQGDFGACVLIARRMMKTPEELRSIQLGKKLKVSTKQKIREAHLRGHQLGTIKSWNEGKKGSYRLKVNRTGTRYSSKLTENDVAQIKQRFEAWRGSVKCKSEINTFARLHCSEYGLTVPGVANILRGKSWKEDIKWV